MSRIGVNSYSSMEETANQLNNKASDYDGLAKEFLDTCTHMQGDAWQGSDSNTFIEQVQALVKNMNSLAEKFRDEAKLINKQKEEYETRQGKVQSDAAGLMA